MQKQKGIILCTLMLFLLSMNTYAQRYDKVLDEIYELEKKLYRVTDDPFIDEMRDTYNIIRRESQMFDNLNIAIKDTVYLVEFFDLYDIMAFPVYNIGIWNKNKALAYDYNLNTPNCPETINIEDSLVSSHKERISESKELPIDWILYECISKWDCDFLCKNGSKNNSLPPLQRILAVRVIFDGNEYVIDHCIFYEPNFINFLEIINYFNIKSAEEIEKYKSIYKIEN